MVVLLDRPLGRPSKIRGVVLGHLARGFVNVLLVNGYGKGNIKKVKTMEIRKEQVSCL